MERWRRFINALKGDERQAIWDDANRKAEEAGSGLTLKDVMAEIEQQLGPIGQK